MESLRHWWHAPGHYQWLSAYIRARGLERQTRILTGLVTGCLGTIPVVMFLSPSGAQGFAARSVATGVSLTCLIMAALWFRRWPTPSQSTTYVLAMNVCCAAGCLAVSNPLAGLSAATCFSILAGYVAFFHSARIFVVTLAFTVSTTVVLGVEVAVWAHDAVLAICKVVLVVLSVVAIPFVNQMLMAYVGVDVVNSDVDPLTGLSNRRGFERRTNHLIAASKESSWPSVLSIIMIDLDAFKTVNDTRGHAAGDRALVAVGEILQRNCHPDRAVVARIGGEEFLIADVWGEDTGVAAQRMCRDIAEAPISVTASVGVASGMLDDTSSHAEVLSNLVAAADAAMYEAKRAGGNRVVCRMPRRPGDPAPAAQPSDA